YRLQRRCSTGEREPRAGTEQRSALFHGRAVARRQAKAVSFTEPQSGMSSFAEPARLPEDNVEHPVQGARRTADDAGGGGGSRLAFARIVSNTRSRSLGELLMMPRMWEVAVSRSSASLSWREVAFSRCRDSPSSRVSCAIGFSSLVAGAGVRELRRAGFPVRR